MEAVYKSLIIINILFFLQNKNGNNFVQIILIILMAIIHMLEWKWKVVVVNYYI